MKTLALTLITTLTAAAAAFTGNRWAYRRFGHRAAVTVVPAYEECLKFLAAALVPAVPILYVHALFGLVELAYDWWRSEPEARFIGLFSFAVHGLVGSFALLALDGGLGWLGAFAIAVAVHGALNVIVLYVVLPALGAGVPATSGKR